MQAYVRPSFLGDCLHSGAMRAYVCFCRVAMAQKSTRYPVTIRVDYKSNAKNYKYNRKRNKGHSG